MWRFSQRGMSIVVTFFGLSEMTQTPPKKPNEIALHPRVCTCMDVSYIDNVVKDDYEKCKTYIF